VDTTIPSSCDGIGKISPERLRVPTDRIKEAEMYFAPRKAMGGLNQMILTVPVREDLHWHIRIEAAGA
jgi:hypothetical protein